jgi:hypothetical protein
MRFEMHWMCEKCTATTTLGAFASDPDGHAGVVDPALATLDDVPAGCVACGHDRLLLFAYQVDPDPVQWLLAQPGDVQWAYLALREGGMGDETAREMAVVAHLPAPE